MASDHNDMMRCPTCAGRGYCITRRGKRRTRTCHRCGGSGEVAATWAAWLGRTLLRTCRTREMAERWCPDGGVVLRGDEQPLLE